MKKMTLKLSTLSGTTTGLLALVMASGTAAAPGTLANTPLFLQSGSVQPNIFFMVDDSGSMDWEVLKSTGALAIADYSGFRNRDNLDYTPDRTDRDELLESCAGYNVLYYNPNTTYTPWTGVDINGNAYQDQSITAALNDPYNPASGSRDLTDDEGLGDPPGYMTWSDDGDGVFEQGECPDANDPGFDYNSQFVATVGGFGPTRVMTAAEQTNFANWYSYYRKREYVAKRALSQIIDASDARMGLATLHNNNTVRTLVRDVDDITTPVDTTAQANKGALMRNLFRVNSSGRTPLRQALHDTGEYFADNSGWGPTPILPASQGGECQQNFTILMSDGFWNGGDPVVGNTDQDGTGPFDGGDYADTFSNTLADVAMAYYETDLSPLADKVPVNAGIDENNAQHMVTYTVGFGVDGTLAADQVPGQPNFNGWPQPTADTQTTIDDMRHAAFNGRGQFLSARDPEELIDSLGQYIANIEARKGTAASVSFNSTNLNTGTRVFQSIFDSSRWSGDLLAKDILIDPVTKVATISGTAWQASTDIDGRTPASRQIVTYDDTTGSGVNFAWNALNSAQQSDLRTNPSGGTDNEATGMARLDFIRGNRGCESGSLSTCSYTDTNGDTHNSKSLRDRISALGDIVHSSPYFVGPPSLGYPDSIEPSAPYSAFAISNRLRPGITYVGANDGMLHAFNDNGVEVFAYIPASLFSTDADAGLHYLSDPSYTHRYYVDLSPTVQDAYISVGGTTAWRSILVGALRGGGKGLFAIDVTYPSALASNAAGQVMWEFSHNDLGYTFSDIQIGKMNNGKWAAIFGNGYNNDPSGDGRAKLFILYLDGSNAASPIIIDTGVGTLDPTSKDCANANSDCNGLSTPRLADLNGDGTIDRIYAGDLHGNLWAFNVTDKISTGSWLPAYGANPLFRACSAMPCSSNRQPITGQPDVTLHPTQTAYSTRPNTLVFFGTGQYLTQADNANSQLQSFYGVWDSNTGNLDRSALQAQTLQTTYNDAVLGNVRTITSNPVNYSSTEKGWLIDLPISGERSVTNPAAFGSVVFFNTVIPSVASSNMCGVGGSGWLMAVDLLTGGEPAFIPIDVNNDGVFDSTDQLSGVSVVGTDSSGVPAESRFISNKRVTADSTGAINIDNIQSGPPEIASRMSWSELEAP